MVEIEDLEPEQMMEWLKRASDDPNERAHIAKFVFTLIQRILDIRELLEKAHVKAEQAREEIERGKEQVESELESLRHVVERWEIPDAP